MRRSGGATQSFAPEITSDGIVIPAAAVMEEGVVLAAANEICVVMLESYCTARKDEPPPIE